MSQSALPLPELALRPSAPAIPKPRAIHLSGYGRKGCDFYATPTWVTEALLQHVHFRAPIWEPCCGDGTMSKALSARGYHVTSTDLIQRGFGKAGVDFLECGEVPAGCGAIVTNPPYGDTGTQQGQARSSNAMLGFLRHALGLTASVQGQLALLVRLNWIAGQRVAGIMSAAPFAAVIVLTSRIRWFDMGEQTNSAQHHHAWVVFDHAHPAGAPPALLYV